MTLPFSGDDAIGIVALIVEAVQLAVLIGSIVPVYVWHSSVKMVV